MAHGHLVISESFALKVSHFTNPTWNSPKCCFLKFRLLSVYIFCFVLSIINYILYYKLLDRNYVNNVARESSSVMTFKCHCFDISYISFVRIYLCIMSCMGLFEKLTCQILFSSHPNSPKTRTRSLIGPLIKTWKIGVEIWLELLLKINGAGPNINLFTK